MVGTRDAYYPDQARCDAWDSPKEKIMNEQMKKKEVDVLVGPPGLLLGLTLFVFLTARICCGMFHTDLGSNLGTDPITPGDIVCEMVKK